MKRLIQRILFATDFSASSERSFDVALRWAEASEAELDIVHVMGRLHEVDLDLAAANLYIEEQEKHSRSKLDALVSQAKKKLAETRSHLLEGIPTDEITALALSSQADLIITGTHGWTGVDRVMMGSVAERVICKAPCPVLSIRDVEPEKEATTHVTQAATSTPRHILLPLDFSDCSLDAYEYADNLQKFFEASVTLVHVIEPLSYSIDFTLSHPAEDRKHREEVKSRLDKLTNAFTRQGLTAQYVIKHKPVSEAILEALTESRADIIVMGTHGRQGLQRLIMGNVAAAVLRQSPVPVLTVKSPKFKHKAQNVSQESIKETHS